MRNKTQRQQRLAIANAFRQAKHQLAHSLFEIKIEGKRRYICYALNAAWRNGRIAYDDYVLASKLITTRLEGYISLEEWLVRKHGLSRDTVFVNVVKLQVTRHAWLDSLIKEFSN